MRLYEYFATSPRGTKARVAREARTTYPTVHKYGQKGAPPMPYDLAQLVSVATRGVVSLHDLMFPEPVATKRPRRAA